MPTYSALTTLSVKDDAEALGVALENFLPEPTGIGVFEIEDGSGRWEVGAYFDDIPDETELALLSVVYGAEPFVVSEVPETDWVAHVRRELHPIEAGRFFLHGAHDAGSVPEGTVPLLIEAQMAFGTGHHGTTRGCLLAIDRLAQVGFQPKRVIDIGCGTAVLAMAAARVWPDEAILASDNDPVAVDVARANARANGLDDKIVCIEAAGFDHPQIMAAAPFDLIVANILKGPLIELAPEMARNVSKGGRVILSGILTTQANEVALAYVVRGFVSESHEDLGEWSTLVLRRDH
jgi:ribosomal protein L11 methyltransferase